MSESINKIYDEARKRIEYYISNPEMVSEEVNESILSLFKKLCEFRGVSDHSAWGVKWKLFKKHDENDAEPYETLSGDFTSEEALCVVGNVILNGGANQMLKLICGIPDSTAYDSANAKIYVGTDETPERAEQTGVLASGGSKAYTGMDSGYPQVAPNGRTAIFRGTFGDSAANFPWREMSLSNGNGVGSTALNRKTADMGTKNGGVWSLQLEISIVEVA